MKHAELEDAKSIQTIIKEIGHEVRSEALRQGVRVTYLRDGVIYALENGKELSLQTVVKARSFPMPQARRLISAKAH